MKYIGTNFSPDFVLLSGDYIGRFFFFYLINNLKNIFFLDSLWY